MRAAWIITKLQRSDGCGHDEGVTEDQAEDLIRESEQAEL